MVEAPRRHLELPCIPTSEIHSSPRYAIIPLDSVAKYIVMLFSPTVEGKVRSRLTSGEEVRAWGDPETGCQYFLWERRQRAGMTPRLAADGRSMCNR